MGNDIIRGGAINTERSREDKTERGIWEVNGSGGKGENLRLCEKRASQLWSWTTTIQFIEKISKTYHKL